MIKHGNRYENYLNVWYNSDSTTPHTYRLSTFQQQFDFSTERMKEAIADGYVEIEDGGGFKRVWKIALVQRITRIPD